jgi:hypothetical protein
MAGGFRRASTYPAVGGLTSDARDNENGRYSARPPRFICSSCVPCLLVVRADVQTKKSPGGHALLGKIVLRPCAYAEDLRPRGSKYIAVSTSSQPSRIPGFIRDAHRVLSTERLHEYRRAQTDTALQRLGYYAWNIALCEALYPALHLCEVTLRNSLFEVLKREFPVVQRGTRTTCWLDDGTRVLTQEHAERVAAAKRKLLDRLKGSRTPFTPGRLVAEMSFGFWTYLFDSESGYVSPRSPGLWPRLLEDVFPYLPDTQTVPRRRADFASRFAKILRLRNRAFHHEPLWKEPDLHLQHARLVETIGWMSPAAAGALKDLDRFPWVWQESTARYLRRTLRQIAQR